MLKLVFSALTLGTGLVTSCATGDARTEHTGQDRPVVSVSKPSADDPAARDGIALPARAGEPCWHAEKHSLSDLADLADVPVWLPESSRASEETLTGAWTCGGDTPVLTFGPITVSYESGYRTPLDWERKAVDSGGEVRTILGQPGLLTHSTSSSVKGEVMVIVDGGVLIRVLGEPEVPPEDLVAVADSIHLDAPVQP